MTPAEKPESEDASSATTRRRMLATIAASAGTVVAGQMITSQSAFAAATRGSNVCCYRYSSTPIMTSTTGNVSGSGTDTLTTAFSQLGGTCPCGGTATIEYAYYVEVDIGIGTFGWTTSSSVSWSAGGGKLFDNNGSLTAGAAIRVTCGGRTGTSAVCCRFARNGPPAYSVPLGTRNFVLNVTGTSPPSGVTLPSCGSGLARSAGGAGTLIATPN